MRELEVQLGRRTVLVRDTGPSGASPIVYFHGTPGSRLDLRFGDAVAASLGVRVVSFDRPGYGRSSPAPYSLTSIAHDVAAVADAVGLDRFATLGWSGGGPFALAAAAVLGERVTRVGVAGGLAPPQLMPGGTAAFTDNDRLALSFLPDEPERAAAQLLVGGAEMLRGLLSVRDDEAAPWIDWMWGETDPEVIAAPALRANLFLLLHEGLRQGPEGIAWDNVAWCGPWGVDLAAVRCPVHLWYGDRDEMVPLANGSWLQEHLPSAELVVCGGEGHLVPMRHWREMASTLAG
ncbi:alpha/beta hydrolase [Rhodococcus sp. X156]|uniref:alpha/beta fold hydrolase n=1 Tax=Rhodococcus sp. X156 TaxID=2499145 RepID=UPI000FDA4867|nr:alpha/beta hydrolase [Rhodococcus sp. X156]